MVKERDYGMVDFKEADLKRANLEVANLRAANPLEKLTLKKLTCLILKGTHLVKVNIEGVFNGLTLKGANNLIEFII